VNRESKPTNLFRPRSLALKLMGAFLLVACVPQQQFTEIDLPAQQWVSEDFAQRDLPALSPWLAVVGRASFSPADLSPEQRVWYDRVLEAIANSRDDMVNRAERDNAYDFGRSLFQYNAALLVALRATGDLRFLDEVDTVVQVMRNQLSDTWCEHVPPSVYVNTSYGRVSEPDGFRNFRLRMEGVRDHCRDTGDLNEALTHGHLAMVMHAYHENRDQRSPAGVDYGERADFWLAYLREDFEAKWRARSDTKWPGMDFIDLKFCHTFAQMLLYYQFVGLRLQADGSPEAGPYLREAMRLTDALFGARYVPGRRPGGFVDVDTPVGRAVIYAFGGPLRDSVSSVHLRACPTTYARYMLTSVLALRLEGVERWDDDIVARLSHGLAHFVVSFDTAGQALPTFAVGVSGVRRVAGMPPASGESTFTSADFLRTPFAAFTAWDESGKLEAAALRVYEAEERDVARPRHVFVPAGMLLAATVEGMRE
jgi:hypothetical protein